MRLFEVVNSPTDLFMVCEFVSGGELFEYIVDSGRLAPPEARRIFRQLISGVGTVAHVHNKGIRIKGDR